MEEIPQVEGQKTKSIIVAQNLEKAYDQVQAVNDLSFKIRKGEIYGLLGPNGAGKTTTIKMILGLLAPDKGGISLLDLNPSKEPQQVKKRIGYVAEEPLLYNSMTPRELFDFIASIRELDPKPTAERAYQLLDSLDALKYYDSIIATLSRGNKQKIQIIASLIHDPELLILDEPLQGLDAKSRKIVKSILDLHTNAGRSILLSTHAMEDAQGLCDRIGIISEGQLIAEGTLDELQRKSASGGSKLEDVFLKITQQDESVEYALENLRKAYDNAKDEEIQANQIKDIEETESLEVQEKDDTVRMDLKDKEEE